MITYPNVVVIGPAGSGKDTVGEILQTEYGYTTWSLATALKTLMHDPVWQPFLEVVYPQGVPSKLRREYQQMGDLVRSWDENMFCKLTWRRIQQETGDRPWAILDVRRENEWRFFQTVPHPPRVIGLTMDRDIRLQRIVARDGGLPDGAWEHHPSEQEPARMIEQGMCDAVIANNGTLEELHQGVDAILRVPLVAPREVPS